MNLTVEYQPITELFRNAHTEGRHFLYEFEVYNLLSLSGSHVFGSYRQNTININIKCYFNLRYTGHGTLNAA